MRYKELVLNTTPEEIELRCEELEELGIEGFIIEDGEDFKSFLANNTRYWDYVDEALAEKYENLSRIKFYVNDDEEGTALFKKLLGIYPSLECSVVQDSDWENNWREFYKPMEIGPFAVIPEWERENYSSDLTPLVLDPGLIFGTGSHATTKMCLRSLGDFAGEGKRVLDLGCGSGILGIGALNLGCRSCVSVDIDPMAPAVVRSNAELNGLGEERLLALSGDVLSDEGLIMSLGSGYDIVLANIVADVIKKLAPKVRDFMAEGAVYICSGIIDGREKEIEKVLKDSGFEIVSHLREEEWNAFVCR